MNFGKPLPVGNPGNAKPRKPWFSPVIGFFPEEKQVEKLRVRCGNPR